MVSLKLFTRKNDRTKKLLIVGIVVLLIAASAVVFYKNKQDNHDPVTPVTATPSVEDTPPILDGGTDGSDKTPPQYEAPSVTDNSSIDGVINFKSVVNGVLSIRATINQRISTGNCTLTLTRPSDNKQIIKTAEIVPNPSSATCKGFDIPVSELGSGAWNIVIEVTDGSKSGKIIGDVAI